MNNSDWIALASAVVAAAALVATFWQAHLTRKHNRLSVRPHVEWHLTRMTGTTARLELVNNGLGPTIVDFVELRVLDKTYRLDGVVLWDLARELKLHVPFNVITRSISPGSPLAPGDRLAIIECDPDESRIDQRAVASSLLTDAGLTCRYKSMYGEQFEVRKAAGSDA